MKKANRKAYILIMMQDKMVLDFLCLDCTTHYQVTGALWPSLSSCEMKSTDQIIPQEPSCFEILKVPTERRPGHVSSQPHCVGKAGDVTHQSMVDVQMAQLTRDLDSDVLVNRLGA